MPNLVLLQQDRRWLTNIVNYLPTRSEYRRAASASSSRCAYFAHVLLSRYASSFGNRQQRRVGRVPHSKSTQAILFAHYSPDYLLLEDSYLLHAKYSYVLDREQSAHAESWAVLGPSSAPASSYIHDTKTIRCCNGTCPLESGNTSISSPLSPAGCCFSPSSSPPSSSTSTLSNWVGHP